MQRPADAILGEEYGAASGQSGLTWVLDPIDGTRGFVSGTPTWGVLIALSDDNGPFFGIIDQPYIGERFIGTSYDAMLTGSSGTHPLKTRTARDISAEGAAFAEVSRKARLTRYGMDCYAYALVAAGQVDLVIEAGLQAYDIQAPIAVVQAAGGIVTDWQGGPAHLGGRAVAAANAEIHAQALEILRDCAP